MILAELVQGEAESEESELCYSCVFGQSEEEEEQNCSLVVRSGQCQYCNTSQDCQSAHTCRHFPPQQAVVGQHLGLHLGLCHTRSSLRSVFPQDPLGRIISFGLLALVLSVMSFIFLR